ncbi:MAG: sulfotransferase [Woeseia sp.]
MSVARWTDLLSGLQARYPGFWIGLGNLESRILADRLADTAIEKPIYIAGLARSGTTILLELLSRHPQLASHRYRDFPPILTPWFWNWFVDRAGTRDEGASERAHGDGIEVTAESPEAFEEVIWMAFFRNLHDPDASSALSAETTNKDFEKFYRDHIRKLLLIRGGRRYLCKANYNLTRLAYLLKLSPDARFIVSIRDPVWHIASLMRQHQRFCREHRRDVRLQRHMSRSGHFEFGLDRRPINNGNTPVTREVRELWLQEREVEGWALYWKDVYGHVADVLKSDAALRRATLVVNYETLCAKPEQVMAAVIAHCELPSDGLDLAAEAERRIRHPSYYQPAFTQEQVELIETVTGPVTGRLDTLAA